ncbi:hypothetical protein [Peloplasma aerotolerans]|uniref:Uncharacterized protein n=1 Tax=Peloplasma aerotolerans TaxID=3044389 RepID=A0AAW6UBZ5_9MOLU|nr:hypothetical protein [Mariniplasma sp. M4Ah]MDI6452473.1 hypothetical protein [Mariniplasma sp. M4Ah]
MKRIMLKKMILSLFIAVAFLFLVNLLGFHGIKGIDYQESSSWKGHDLGFVPQSDVNFESQYVPFGDIIESISSIDVNKKYVIESAYDLYMFSELSRGPHKTAYLSLNYVLGGHIDYYEIVQQNISYRYIPVGFLEPFTGTFDGQGYEITNLFFQSILSEDDYNNNYPGLRFFAMFSRVSSTGVVKNLGLINPIIIQPIEWGIMDHVSIVAGENFGLIENVYVIDERGTTAGLNVEGAFNISGLVSINQGTFRYSYIASPHIKSSAVVDNISTHVVSYLNLGTMNHVYYDESILVGVDTITTIGIGLTTEAFQNHTYFSEDWFFNDSYHGLANGSNGHALLTLNDTYPILQGLKVNETKMYITNAVDFVYMNKLLNTSGYFRDSHYQITHDIDMNQVSATAYQAARVAFTGTLSGSVSSESTRLYERNSSQGGDINYHTILNLRITIASEVGNFASYALFSSFFGTVENINFVNYSIETSGINNYTHKAKILVGSIAGQMNSGMIHNVHVHGNIHVVQSPSDMTKLYVGGLVGEGSGLIDYASTNGTLVHDLQSYHAKSSGSATGGFVGRSNGLTVEYGYNALDITGLGYLNMNTSVTYIGGIIGFGQIDSMLKVINEGLVLSHDEMGYLHTLYAGGIIGLSSNQLGAIKQIYNEGNVDVIVNNPLTLTLAGFGFVDGSNKELESRYEFVSITNNGRLRMVLPSGNNFNQSELGQFNIRMAGVVIADQVDAAFYGLFNDRNVGIDMSLVNQYAGVLSIENTTNSSVTQAYNTGLINVVTENVITDQTVKISGNILGSNMDYEHLRNEGDINIEFNHNTTFASGNLYVYGLFEEVSQNKTANNGFNGGHISIIQNQATIINFNVFASGVTHANKNTNYFSEHDINHMSIENITGIHGSIDNVLNHGNILIDGSFNGSTRASGIVMINESLLTTAINLGNIINHNDIALTNGEVASAGISYLLAGQYAQVKDSANYGRVEALSLTTNGFAHASGIVVRNDLNANLSVVSSGTLSKYAKILFSINYGDIYAFSGNDESAYAITSETRSKASGIFASGLLTIMNTINYGNAYSKYLAAGIFGFVYLNRFGTIQSNQVYIANNMNYGKTRQITGYVSDYTINMMSIPTRTSFNAFSSFIGKFHTGTTTWEFLSNSSYALYPLDLINFGFNHNFDSIANMLGNAPATTMDPNLAGGDPRGQGNTLLTAIVEKLSTTNLNDQSIAPFTPKELGEHPKVAIYGMPIPKYQMDETTAGVFNPLFIFRRLPVRTSGPDQYLKNYFAYMPLDKANSDLVDRLEENTSNTYMGLYVLSSSEGINNGIFIPDHLDLETLNPHHLNEDPDTTWLGVKEDSNSIIYKLTIGMSQLEMTYATTIYDLEIMQVDSNGNPIQNGLTLKKPIIDEDRGMITYYLPSNASIINHITSSQVMTTSFVEASEGVGRKVPDYYDANLGDWVYKWVGDYKKVGDDYVAIGPYDTVGTHHVTFSSIQYEIEYNRSNEILVPVYSRSPVLSNIPGLNYVHKHVDHIYSWTGNQGNYRYIATGYTRSTATPADPGYGAYRFVTHSNPGTQTLPYYINGTYEYVGPSKELVTYVESEQSINTVFDDAGVYFQANLAPDTYMLANGATFYENGSPILTSTTIPLSYGIYDSLNDATTGELIDKLEYHYGSVRVFSDQYDGMNPNTYRDYQIRIIRTADQYLDSLNTLSVNGINAMPSYSDFRDVIATQDIHYEKDGDLGVLSFSYSILNASNEYNVLPLINLYHDVTDEMIDRSLYILLSGVVVNENQFNNLTGVWGIGVTVIDFEVTDKLPSGAYRLELELVTGEVAMIHFSKIESSNGFLLDITYQGKVVVPQNGNIFSNIPFGIHYLTSDESTHIVNFTNLESLTNIYEEDLTNGLLPDYLENMTISPFATLISVDLSITMIDSYRYRYTITYDIEAEDGTPFTYTHVLEENEISTTPEFVYQNGGEIEKPYGDLMIGYNESPTIRVELDTDRIYFPHDEVLNIYATFTPENGVDQAIENQHYFMSLISGIGYQVDFNKNTPIGYYQTHAEYEYTINLWGQSFTWVYVFDTISAHKLKNNESMLLNITFVSDTVFSGFNTIVDTEVINEPMYINYLQHPETRKMSVLPTTGIFYGEYANLPDYWIIGQVQRTSLTAYTPNFILPDGAIIRRVVDQENIGYEYQSILLTTDFEGTDGVIKYIQYRVYAHDYDDNPTNYTDYFVAVQDVTNNIRFNLTVINDTDEIFDKIFVKINVCRVLDEETPCTINDMILSMNALSYYDATTDSYINNQFQTTAYGVYLIYVDLPVGYTFSVQVQQVSIDGSQFFLEDSVLPRKYYVTITIIEQAYDEAWGYQEIIDYEPQDN